MNTFFFLNGETTRNILANIPKNGIYEFNIFQAFSRSGTATPKILGPRYPDVREVGLGGRGWEGENVV